MSHEIPYLGRGRQNVQRKRVKTKAQLILQVLRKIKIFRSLKINGGALYWHVICDVFNELIKYTLMELARIINR